MTMLYTETPVMKLHEWIPIDKVNWATLSYNRNAIQLCLEIGKPC